MNATGSIPDSIMGDLKKNFFFQEFFINCLTVPALSYFIVVLFPFAKIHLKLIIELILITTVASFTYGYLSRRFMLSKIYKFEKGKEDVLKQAKLQALRFPFLNAINYMLRWNFFGTVVVVIPFLVMGEISFFEFILLSLFMFFSSLGSVSFSFLSSESIVSGFLKKKEVARMDVEKENKYRLLITPKILLVFGLTLIQAIGLLITAVISAEHAGVKISSVYLGFFILSTQILLTSIVTVILFSKNMKMILLDVISFLREITQSDGDLRKSIFPVSGDELSEMAKWFNLFIQNLREIIKEIVSKTGMLDSSSGNLFETAGFVSGISDKALNKSNSVARSSDIMKDNLAQISETMSQATSNIDLVAVATEQMSQTINEISQNSEKARGVTQDAVSFMGTVKEQVTTLKDSTTRVGHVTEVITDISDQINLLALNATIESSRAGEYGKGFAVVSSEIKDLAQRTADSTKEITHQIKDIQTSASDTIELINKVHETVVDISDIVITISSAVEEQAVVTRDIAGNTETISSGNKEVNSSIAQVSKTSASIADDISEVNAFVQKLSGGSSDVNSKAEELSQLSDQLRHMVHTFKV